MYGTFFVSLVQIRIVGTLGLEKRFQKHCKLKCSKWESRGPPILHIKERGAKDDFAKAELGLVFQPRLFQPRSVSDLLDGGWFGHHNRSVSVFNPIASIKTQKDICKTHLKKRGHGSWDIFLKVGVEHCVAYLCRDKLQSWVCVGLLHSTSRWVYCEAPLVILRQSSRKKDVKEICYSRLHLFLFVGFLVDGPKQKKYKDTAEYK